MLEWRSVRQVTSERRSVRQVTSETHRKCPMFGVRQVVREVSGGGRAPGLLPARPAPLPGLARAFFGP